MEFIKSINALDSHLFLVINGLHNSFFDTFMVLMSDRFVWIPFYIAVIYSIFKHWKKDGLWVILSLILCIVLADQISSSIIKELVHRLRPSRDPSLSGMVHLINGYTGGLYGFVSSHAANTFAFALLTSLYFRRYVYTWSVFIWATIVSYSRIYIGVHYPFDVLGGVIVGISAGLLFYRIIKKFRPMLFSSFDHKVIYESVKLRVSMTVLGVTAIGIIIYSFIQ